MQRNTRPTCAYNVHQDKGKLVAEAARAPRVFTESWYMDTAYPDMLYTLYVSPLSVHLSTHIQEPCSLCDDAKESLERHKHRVSQGG